jgi:hypothetical protein
MPSKRRSSPSRNWWNGIVRSGDVIDAIVQTASDMATEQILWQR